MTMHAAHHLGSFVPAGPRLFLSCPMDVEGSRVWFTDLWNYSLVPYLLEAVREGLQVCPIILEIDYLLSLHFVLFIV